MFFKTTLSAALMLASGVAAAQNVVVRIGSVAPTSGAAAQSGKDNENGARLAIEQLNARGLSIGGSKAKFELVAEDDAADPKQGTAAAQKLADSKVNGVVGHQTSGTSIPASRIYSDAGIPQISPMATNPKYSRQGYKTAFRVVADDAALGNILGQYAVKSLNLKQIALIDDRTAYGQGLVEEFVKGVKSAGGNIIAQQYTSDKATDFASILTSIRASKPDLVFVGALYSTAGPLLRQMKQLGMRTKLMGGDGICTELLVPLAGGSIDDNQVYCADPGGIDPSQKVALDGFKEAYKKRYGIDPEFVSAYAYDAVNVMVDAMVRAGSPDPKVYLAALAKTSGFKGVTGLISFDEKGDLKDGAVTLYTFRKGVKEKLDVIRAK